MSHDCGLAASPPVRYMLKVERSRYSPFPCLPGDVGRFVKPRQLSRVSDMVRQEIYGYLLTHYAISALICRAATEADIDPDRVKFKGTVRIARRRIADPAAFPLSTATASSHG
jgi:hypothetical protein